MDCLQCFLIMVKCLNLISDKDLFSILWAPYQMVFRYNITLQVFDNADYFCNYQY